MENGIRVVENAKDIEKPLLCLLAIRHKGYYGGGVWGPRDRESHLDLLRRAADAQDWEPSQWIDLPPSGCLSNQRLATGDGCHGFDVSCYQNGKRCLVPESVQRLPRIKRTTAPPMQCAPGYVA